MAEHPDVDRLRRALEARSDTSPGRGLRDLLAEEVTWHGGPDGEASGRDDVVRSWNALALDRGPRITVWGIPADQEEMDAFWLP